MIKNLTRGTMICDYDSQNGDLANGNEINVH